MPHKKSKRDLLEPKLIPKKMWGKNVRAVISKPSWDALRWSFGATMFHDAPAIDAARSLGLPKPEEYDFRKKLKCHYCDARQDSLDLHELWEYDDKILKQTLVGFVSVCEDCHLSLHIGRAYAINLGDRAKKHISRVNNWTNKKTEENIEEIKTKWIERSKNEYSLDLSFIKKWFPDSKIHLNWLEQSNRWTGNRIDAISWAQNILKTNAIIIDTETTGLLDYQKVEVIELAALSMKGKVLYISRFRPRYKILKRVIKIHGITNDDVVDESTFGDKFTSIFKQLNGRTVVAYNAKFDKGVIERTCDLYKKEYPESKWQCAMHIYRVFKESGKWLPLPDSKHNAIDDCKAVLKIIKQMAKG